jgi:Carboxypeptidase regulatory-like domain/TonB dependent receptor
MVGQALMLSRQAQISQWLLILGAVSLSPALSWGGDSLNKTPLKLSGTIDGIVTNTAGSPQMGAAVVLYNREDRVYDKARTDEHGEFRFPGLFPDLYTIRVSLPAFVPALKKDILVQSGVRALLSVNLNTLFSSIQVAYPPAGGGTFMTDDWKWVLRSASSTRPVLRFKDDSAPKISNEPQGSVFSDTRGVLQLSAGDGPLVTGTADQADLGTAFALATSIFGSNHLELSGNLGYGAQTGVPVTAFRTAYASSNGPEISVTMRQLLLPSRSGFAGGIDSGIPALRSVSASIDQRAELTDEVTLQYGLTLDSVSLAEDRLNYFSPYARLVYSLGDNGSVALAYSSGNGRPDLAAGMGESPWSDLELQRDLSSIGLFPRLSMLNARPQIQRGNEFEISYSRRAGSRRLDLSAYREVVSNAALSVVGPAGMYAGTDLLPDLFTGNAIFNAGNYGVSGYTAALTQDFGQNVSATVMYGTMPGLTLGTGELVSNNPDELRSMIRASHREAVTTQVAATAPWTGTHVVASYQWLADAGWLTLGNLYSMQSVRPMPGLNVYIRQPLPHVLHSRLELTADLRNLLAEGYLPLQTANGQQLVLVQTPRSFRGGLNFIF